jgi:tetratricopeptide (TPR) repeat protein
LRKAEALAASLGDQRRLARALVGMTVQFRLLADYDQARDAAERALAIAETLGDIPLRVGANTGLGQAAYATGDYERAAVLFRTNVRTIGGPLSAQRLRRLQPPSIHSRTWLVWSLAELGEFAEARTTADDCAAIARALDYPWALGFAYVGLGVLEIRRGELDGAIQVLQPAFELARTWDIPLWLPRIGGALGYAYALSGRTAEGMELLEQTFQGAAARNVDCWRSLILVNLGEAYLLARREPEASNAAHSALALSRKHKERGHEARCLRLMGEIASNRGQPGEARSRFDEAIELGGTLGMRPLIAHCHLGLGHAPPPHRRARAGPGALHHGDRDVSRDEHAVLAGEGGGRSPSRGRLGHGRNDD